VSSRRLAACPSCARHVRVDERRCPFCAAGLPASFGQAPVVAAPAGRLSRAALYAVSMGALSLSAAQACGGSPSHESKVDGGPADAGEDVVGIPAYGIPPGDAGIPEHSDEDGAATDAGADAYDDGSSQDASPQDGAADVNLHEVGVPIYGAPPHPGEPEPSAGN
jgi:hypothetical protein